MMKANRKHSSTGTMRTFQLVIDSANAVAIITGTAEPDKVLGRMAKSQA